MATNIAVYADWVGLVEPLRLGWLHARRGSTREVFEFEFDAGALTHPAVQNLHIDPRVGLFEGRQHPPQGHETFGVFADASPDRWGRLLMRRRLERAQRAGKADKTVRLHESDYLLGVHDTYRSGALRLRLDDVGDFLDNQHGSAAPPFVQLRELEVASLALERDQDNTSAAGDDWLRMLIAPGGSLGGARPKASVVDPQGQLWIAKFPSVHDAHDMGAWELVDRTPEGRLHFASAMTLTDHLDGDDASTGASYLEIARVLIKHGAQTDTDLHALWSRIVFNMLVSNTDDHLRNHGFILVPGKGWRLSDAYDMNPVPESYGLKLNVSEADNAMDLDLARSVAPYFRVSKQLADEVITRSQAVVRQWPKIADSLQIRAREQELMAAAFRLAG
jgi:serine/threonine-protein kinase HipA